MKEINITIRDKIAENVSGSGYVCGSSDYMVIFDFDAEWDEFDTKTARFVKQDRTFTDVVFGGNECPMPILSNTYNIYVGVFAGDLHTTTPAHISAKKSILCDGGIPAAPSEDVYARIIAMLNSIEQPAAEDIQYQATIEETPVSNVAEALDLLKEGAGGAKTWADLGESIDFEITWDGSTEGREVISNPMSDDVTLNYYKVSDEYLTADRLVGAVMTVSGVADGASSFIPETYTITAGDVSTEDTGVVSVGYQDGIIWVYSIPSGTEYGSQGVYVLLAEAEVMSQILGITIEDNIFATKLRKDIICPVPAEYLPEPRYVEKDCGLTLSVQNAFQATSAVYTVPCSFTGAVVGKRYDFVVTPEGNKIVGNSTYSAAEPTTVSAVYEEGNQGLRFSFGSGVPLVVRDSEYVAYKLTALKLISDVTGYGSAAVLVFEKTSYWGLPSGFYQWGTLTIETNIPNVQQAFESFDLWSSTEGSTKRFKITVDDSGTLSATDVTF